MIEEMRRCLATKPPHIHIRKWRLTYAEALGLANEVYALRLGSNQTPADILMTICDGTFRMFNIPVEVKFQPGQVYPIDPKTIRYRQRGWLASWM